MLGYKAAIEIADTLGKDMLLKIVDNIISCSTCLNSEATDNSDLKLIQNFRREVTCSAEFLHKSFNFQCSEQGRNYWFDVRDNKLSGCNLFDWV